MRNYAISLHCSLMTKQLKIPKRVVWHHCIVQNLFGDKHQNLMSLRDPIDRTKAEPDRQVSPRVCLTSKPPSTLQYPTESIPHSKTPSQGCRAYFFSIWCNNFHHRSACSPDRPARALLGSYCVFYAGPSIMRPFITYHFLSHLLCHAICYSATCWMVTICHVLKQSFTGHL